MLFRSPRTLPGDDLEHRSRREAADRHALSLGQVDLEAAVALVRLDALGLPEDLGVVGRFGAAAWEDEVLRDPLNILKEAQARRPERPKAQAPTELREPLATFGLAWPTTLDAVKLRYKELAKRHHPDANGGSKQAEERLKSINVDRKSTRLNSSHT